MKKSFIAGAVFGALLFIKGLVLILEWISAAPIILGFITALLGIAMLVVNILRALKKNEEQLGVAGTTINLCSYPFYLFVYFLIIMIGGYLGGVFPWIYSIIIVLGALIMIGGCMLKLFSKDEKQQGLFKFAALIFIVIVLLSHVFGTDGSEYDLTDISFAEIIIIAAYFFILSEHLDFKAAGETIKGKLQEDKEAPAEDKENEYL